MTAPSSNDAILAVFFLFLLYRAWRRLSAPGSTPLKHSVAILVLGDIGRSPRMMYHAESFSKLKFKTYILGYRGSKLIPSLKSLPHRTIYLSHPPVYLRRLPFILLAPVKITMQVLTILNTLLYRIPHPTEFIIVQNPPSIPTLAVVWVVAKLRGSKIIIDWHNLGYSILALRLGQRHLFVRIAKWFEGTFGRSAYAHLFVTQAMHDQLVKQWRLKGRKAVLHDRPPQQFRPANPAEAHTLFLNLLPSLLQQPELKDFLPESSPPYATPFTVAASTQNNGLPIDQALPTLSTDRVDMPTMRKDRPALVVSSTSWTPDEDFGILLQALDGYEQRARDANGKLPKVLAIITGKGPLKEAYMNKVQRMREEGKWRYVRCVSVWLEAEDYPILLGSADLGVCLHSSSSGLDLPMKVVDMFGSGLPVCALDFSCLEELVKHDVNGLVFKNADQLTSQLEQLLTDFPSSQQLATLRRSLIRVSSTEHRSHWIDSKWEWGTWDENWTRIVRPLVLSNVGIESTGDN